MLGLATAAAVVGVGLSYALGYGQPPPAAKTPVATS
jgi:hypothetical protein